MDSAPPHLRDVPVRHAPAVGVSESVSMIVNVSVRVYIYMYIYIPLRQTCTHRGRQPTIDSEVERNMSLHQSQCGC